MIIAASYERVSTRHQGQYGFSLGGQRQSLTDFATARGWSLPEHLRFRDGEDDAASGAKWDLPGLQAMLDAAKRGEFSVLAVYDLDRFARSLVKALVLEEELKKHGVAVVYERVPIEDTPEGRMLKRSIFNFAEYEREKISLRTEGGKRRKVESGMVIGANRPPYGYVFARRELGNGKLQIVGFAEEPLEAAIVRRIFRDILTRSTVEIAEHLNADGEPSPTGKAWRQSTINKIVRNTVYAGTWRYTTLDVAVLPLVSQAEWDAAQAAMANRYNGAIRRGRRDRATDPFLLRGTLRCGHCGGMLKTDYNNGRRYYMCAASKPSGAKRNGKAMCPLPAVVALDIEDELWRTLTATLLDPDMLAAGLEAAQNAHSEADTNRASRLATIDHQMKELRQTLSRQVDELIAATGPEMQNALRAKIAEQERLIGKYERERASLAATPHDTLSPDDANAIRAFASEVGTGLDAAAPADKAALYDLLHITGTVKLAEPLQRKNVVKLGRIHRYVIEWACAIPLSITSHGTCATWLVLDTSDGARIEVAA